MMGLRGIFGTALGIAALIFCHAASAQDNLDRDKTPAQLFASDCVLCHKSPQGLAKGGGIFGLSSFLRQHYTASKESAAAIAAYLEAVDRAAGTAQQRGAPPKRAAKPAGKKPEAKPAEAKVGTPKASDAKASEGKPSESKQSDAKPVEAKPAQSKPADAKPGESKPESGKSN